MRTALSLAVAFSLGSRFLNPRPARGRLDRAPPRAYLGEPPRGLVPFIVVVLGMCTFVALMTAYARVTKIVEPQRISQRMPIV